MSYGFSNARSSHSSFSLSLSSIGRYTCRYKFIFLVSFFFVSPSGVRTVRNIRLKKKNVQQFMTLTFKKYYTSFARLNYYCVESTNYNYFYLHRMTNRTRKYALGFFHTFDRLSERVIAPVLSVTSTHFTHCGISFCEWVRFRRFTSATFPYL